MSLRNNRGRATAPSAVLCGLLYCFSTNAFSTDAFSANASSANAGASTQEARVAEQRPANYSIDLSKSPSRQFTIDTLDAAFVKIHFDYFKLPKGMSIEVSDPLRREIYRYGNRERDGFTVDKAMGQNGTTSFSAMSISGPAAVVRLVGVAQEPWTRAHAVRVTRMLEGYPEDMLDAVQPEALRGDVGTRATCVNDKRSAVCYSATDPTAYDRSRPVARLVLARGSNCTAWRVGPGNHMFTNQHCIRTADEAASAEVWFNYQSTTCGGTTSGPVVKVTGASLLKNHGSLDFALFTVNNFASISQFGYLGLDVRTPLQNEQIAIPQHGGDKVQLDPAATGAPDVEIAIAPRFQHQEKDDQDPDQHQRQGRGLWRGIGDRQRHPQRHHRPVGGGVQPRAPDGRTIDLGPVKMRKHPQFG